MANGSQLKVTEGEELVDSTAEMGFPPLEWEELQRAVVALK